ncbi:hypothetical protein ACIA5D_12160 [Actinoplanes sp. NPDC051513]|uniref:hypothetical protein n=1 Tax=Actinoplanes sp. NPDC051513 TaxID=3363908 RepID=UPI0037A28881
MPEVNAFLYDTEEGVDILVQEGADYSVAAARALGRDIAEVLGSRTSELTRSWPGPRAESLYLEMTATGAPTWPRSPKRRKELVQGMERGLGLDPVG